MAHAVVLPIQVVTLLHAMIGFGWETGVAAVATAVYVPLHVRHVVFGLRGTRPPGAGWTLLTMAVVIGGALPMVGWWWLLSFHALAASVLIVAPRRWAVAGFAALVSLAALLSFPLGGEGGPSGDGGIAAYAASVVAWRALSLCVVVWLVAAVRQLYEARVAVAEEAVARERARIDDEVRRTVGPALAAIAVNGQAARWVAPEAAEPQLGSLVEMSRRALAEVRRMVRSYRRGSLRAELDAAADLLVASGVDARLVVRHLPHTSEEPTMRAQLRRIVERLLADDSIRACTITVCRRDGQAVMDCDIDLTGAPDPRATAPVPVP